MNSKIYSVEDIQLILLIAEPAVLVIRARGLVPTSGWKNSGLSEHVYLRPPADGMMDFDFVAQRPEGLALQVLTPIVVEYIWRSDLAKVQGVRVHASTNNREALLADARQMGGHDVSAQGYDPWPLIAGGGEPFPW